MAQFDSGGGGGDTDSGTDTAESDAADQLTERDEGSGSIQDRVNEAFGVEEDGSDSGGGSAPPSSGPPAPARPSDRDAASPLGGGLDSGGVGGDTGTDTGATDAADRGQPGGGITSGGGDQTQEAPETEPEQPKGEGVTAGDNTQKAEVGDTGPGGGIADPVGTYTSPGEPERGAYEAATEPEFDESDQQDLGDDVVGNDIERQLNRRSQQLTQFGEVGGEVVGTTLFRPVGTAEAVANGQSYEEFATTDESQGEQVTQSFLGQGVGGTLAIPTATASAGIEVLETGAYLAGQSEDAQGTTFGERAYNVGDQGAFLFASTVRETARDPAGALGETVFGLGTSAAIGKAAGVGARVTRDRVRTGRPQATYRLTGGQLVNENTGRLYDPRAPDPDNPEEARFPGADDPELYRENPPEAVRQQADDYTPDEVEQRFEEAGVTEGTTLKKAIEVEPDAPQTRRLPSRTVSVPDSITVRGREIGIPDRLSGEREIGGQRVSRSRGGFETQAGDYESPGGFAGPEFSAYFLGLEERTAGFSLRPGLPDTGDQATGALIRTRVDRPDAENMDQFRQEMLDLEGETTARTKPESEVYPGEIESVIPPNAEFARLPGGPVRGGLRSLGIGSDFAVRIGGRRVPGTDRYIGGRKIPLRPAADPELIDSPSRVRRFADFLRDERGQVGGGRTGEVRTQSFSDLYAPMERPVDRPAPVAIGGPTPTADGNETATRPSDARETPAAPDTIPTRPDTDTSTRDRDDDTDTSRDRTDSTRDRDTDTTRRDTRGGGDSDRGNRRTPGSRDSTGRGGSGRSGTPPGGSGGGGPSGGGRPGGEDRTIPPRIPDTPGRGTPDTPRTPPFVPGGGGGTPYGGGGGGSSERANRATLFPDQDVDRREREEIIFGARDPVFVDFIDPLSGDVIETSREGA